MLFLCEDKNERLKFLIYIFQLFVTDFVCSCPKADCVVMRNNPVKEAGKWADESCDNNRGYICQIKAGIAVFF